MFIDIAFNVTDKAFENNLEEVIKDCINNDVMPLFVGLDLESSLKCILLSEKYKTCCYLGFHPCHLDTLQKETICSTCDIPNTTLPTEKVEEKYSSDEDLKNKICSVQKSLNSLNFDNKRVIGIGECGLDYFRSDKKSLQKEIFKLHLDLNKDLPYFLHCRDSHDDFMKIIREFKYSQSPNESHKKEIKGVVHSFDGTLEQALCILEEGFYIGINGCSLKNQENINVVKQIPIERILLETDSPYCLIRKSYAASNFTTPLKSKINSPKNVKQIAEVIALLKGASIDEIEKIVFENTLEVFPKLKEFVNEFLENKDSK